MKLEDIIRELFEGLVEAKFRIGDTDVIIKREQPKPPEKEKEGGSGNKG